MFKKSFDSISSFVWKNEKFYHPQHLTSDQPAFFCSFKSYFTSLWKGFFLNGSLGFVTLLQLDNSTALKIFSLSLTDQSMLMLKTICMQICTMQSCLSESRSVLNLSLTVDFEPLIDIIISVHTQNQDILKLKFENLCTK